MDIDLIITELVAKAQDSKVSYSELEPYYDELDKDSLRKIDAGLKSNGISLVLPKNPILDAVSLNGPFDIKNCHSDNRSSDVIKLYNRIYLLAYQSDDNDIKEEAQDALLRNNFGLVITTVKENCQNMNSFDPLCQNGIIATWEAIRRFDISKDNTFATYAIYWIRKYINKWYSENDSSNTTPLDEEDGSDYCEDDDSYDDEACDKDSDVDALIEKYLELCIARKDKLINIIPFIFLTHKGWYDLHKLGKLFENAANDLGYLVKDYSYINWITDKNSILIRILNSLERRWLAVQNTIPSVSIKFSDQELRIIHSAIENDFNSFMSLLTELDYDSQVILLNDIMNSYPDDVYIIAAKLSIPSYTINDLEGKKISFNTLSRLCRLPVDTINKIYDHKENALNNYINNG